jgi:WhiB family transcriptional regulator, redox-sensing transcriptional regulator
VTIIESRPMTDSGSAKLRTAGGLQADWAGQGRCLNNDPDALFVRGAAQQNAKVVCQKCPVIAECLADALDNRTEFGVWGGMTERERRAMLRRHPNVASWWGLFQTARLDRGQVPTAS